MSNFLSKLFFFITILYFLSFTVAFIPPVYIQYISILQFAYPYLFILWFIVALITFRRWTTNTFTIVFLFTGIIISYKIPRFYQLPINESNCQTSDIKIMSFNVRDFDLYSWSRDRKVRDKIMDLIAKENPDILCMQDFYHSNSIRYPFKTLDKILALGYKYSHIHYTHIVNDSNYWGIATFSKYHIIPVMHHEIDSIRGNAWILTKIIRSPGDTILIGNLHAASVKFRHHEMLYLESFTDKDKEKKLKQKKINIQEKVFDILKKVNRAMYYRQLQIDTFIKTLKRFDLPIIICTDLNDIPNSYAYEKITQYFDDSFLARGSKTGITYLGPLPGLRIDYIFYSHQFEPVSFNTLDVNLSDHRPIIACFKKNYQN